MSKTKITGHLLIAVAVIKSVVDLLDGGGFDLSAHLDDLFIALNGAGFVFLRDAVGKVEGLLAKKK